MAPCRMRSCCSTAIRLKLRSPLIARLNLTFLALCSSTPSAMSPRSRRAWLQRYGEEDALLSDVRRELAIAAAGGEPGRPIGCSMLPGLPLLQTHVWGLLGVRPFAERDLGLATLAGMLQLDPDCPGLFGDAAIAHALAELGGGVVTWNPDYAGPAALNRAWTLVKDVRDAASLERLRAVAGDAGVHACHTHMSCTDRCPKQISPTAGIAGLKRAIAKAALKGEL